MKKNHIFILISGVLIILASGYFVTGYIDSSNPIIKENSRNDEASSVTAKTEVISVKLTGSGSLLDVRYTSDRPHGFDGSTAYIIDNATGKKLGLLGVPRIGMLRSTSQKNTYGYLIVNNADRTVVNGSKVKVVLGNYTQEKIVSEY